MVQVQSTWFPLYDRNPQRFVPNVFEAKESDFQKATQTIYRSAKHPSAVENHGAAPCECRQLRNGSIRKAFQFCAGV